MDRLFGMDRADRSSGLQVERVGELFPAFSRFERSDGCTCNNQIESYHNWLKHNFLK
jgi:hypothetical protein